MFNEDREIISSIEKVKSSSKTVVYWELGNEVAYKHYSNGIEMQDGKPWSFEVYANKIKKISQYIKKRYPDDKIGVVASEIAEWRNPESVSTLKAEWYRRKWDIGIQSVLSNVDAVVYHPYIFAQKKQINNLDMSCSGKSLAGIELRKFAWISSNISKLPSLYVKRAKERFPGKEIWLSEFGIIDDESGSIDAKINRQTGLRALTMSALYLSWLQQHSQVKVILTHGLFDGYNWPHIVYPDLSLTANGVAYLLLRKFLNDVEEVSSLKITTTDLSYQGVDRYEDNTLNIIYGVVGRNSETETYSMILVNLSNNTLELELPWRAYSKIENSFKWREVIKPGDYGRLKVLSVIKMSAKKVDVSPRSITIFRSK